MGSSWSINLLGVQEDIIFLNKWQDKKKIPGKGYDNNILNSNVDIFYDGP